MVTAVMSASWRSEQVQEGENDALCRRTACSRSGQASTWHPLIFPLRSRPPWCWNAMSVGDQPWLAMGCCKLIQRVELCSFRLQSRSSGSPSDISGWAGIEFDSAFPLTMSVRRRSLAILLQPRACPKVSACQPSERRSVTVTEYQDSRSSV